MRITRRGKAVATLAAIARPKRPVDLAWLEGVDHDVSAADVVNELREAARY